MRPTPRRFLLLVACFAAACARSLAHEVPAEMLAAATTFLSKLSDEQKKLATYPLTDAERENWNFVPIARNGLTFKKMTTEQYALGLAFLRTGLSHTGVARVQATMASELVLMEIEKDYSGRRDPVNYFITLFGEPSADKSWGWRFEGHHCAFNFTVVGGKHVFFTPSFIGSNPAEIRSGPRKGERILGEEEDLAHAFVQSLDAAQQKLAIFAEKAPTEIITTNKKRVSPLSPTGLTAAQLTPAQRERFLALVSLYLGRWRPELAAESFAQFTAPGFDKITFAWAGPTQRGKGATYYRIQSPDYLIEFDNTQNNWNHVHTAVRAFKGDFGHDMLAEHYAKEHKK